MLGDVYVCIFNYLANLKMRKKRKKKKKPKPIGGCVFVRLDFFFFNKAKHFYMIVKELFKG